MTKIYFIDANGQKIAVSVTAEVAEADLESRRAIWRNDAKEGYYRAFSLDKLTDKKDCCGDDSINPEKIYVDLFENSDSMLKLKKIIKTLTSRQQTVLRLLYKGHGVTEISKILSVKKQSVNDIRKSIQKKFKEFLK